jgi:tetratricopeptide (TPR) repeat protein
MDQGWRLGTRWYVPVGELPAASGKRNCVWTIVRQDGDGPRQLLQLWEPRPPEKVLDSLREGFLQRFSQAESMDPGACHFGFDPERVWFLQELRGAGLPRYWAEADPAGRAGLLARLNEELATSRVPRYLAPEVIGLKPGRILAPRVLGEAPWKPAELRKRLKEEPCPVEGGSGDGIGRPWEEAPDLADAARAPIRGRLKELTYLKSLMFGLSATIPMERVLILQGEGGLGHERLCDWTAAAAETEGLWVANLDALPGEKAGSFLERVVQDLIAGLEADLYAASPAVARALSRRLSTFAFLRGGRRADFADRKLEPAEVDAALGALAFAQGRHPRLIQIRSLERATPEVHDLLKELVLSSDLPWMLSLRGSGQEPGSRSCLPALRNSPATATVILDRLEDGIMAEVLGDLLGPNDLPPACVAGICAASLGNPGLLHSILEMAQTKGSLLRRGGQWTGPEGSLPQAEGQEDRVQEILAGRLQRLNPVALALVRYLALMDGPLPQTTLGRALGLDADGVGEALQVAAAAKLVLTGDGSARIANPMVRDLALARLAPQEAQRWARVLLKIIEEETGRPVLSVRLQAFARDRKTALAQVLLAIRRELPGPQEADRIVAEALLLEPDPRQKARLWEFLADSWCLATEGDRMPAGGSGDSPWSSAWDALDRAIQALAEAGPGEAGEEQAARFHRKKGMLELRLRRFREAGESFRLAAACLADHPFHPEQPRLRLGLGKLQMLNGNGAKGLETLAEGLELLGQKSSVEGHRDQAALLLELGRAQAQRAQFQRATQTLESARRILEHLGDRRRLVGVLDALGQVQLALGQTDLAHQVLKEALDLARLLDDVALTAACHLNLGIQASCQQFLGPALAHLESALRRFEQIGERAPAAQAQAWKARTLAAMGESGLAELVQLKASELPTELLTPMELGDRVFLDGEVAGFRAAWAEARRHFQAAGNRFEQAGLSWRERLARLRTIQAEAQDGLAGPGLTSAWIRLEGLKGTVEGSGSRWLEMEWHRAHALLLSISGADEAIAGQTLLAWGEVLAGAREMHFPALVLEASARSAQLLLDRGERLGARGRVQDAWPSFQLLWSKLPEAFEPSFLGRSDLHGFRQASEAAGMPFHLPERVDPLADWSPTLANLPLVPFPRKLP